MSVRALNDGYTAENRDALANFHGNQLVYLHWEGHLEFCAALTFPLPPQMPFAAVTGELLPQFYGMHPDWAGIDWEQARWTLNGEPFTPDPAKSLADQGIGHKALLRFWT